MSTKGLTEKQKQFCKNIVSGMNNGDAYINAYNHTGKLNTAQVEATKLLNKENVQEYIQTLNRPKIIHAQIQGMNARDEQIAFIKERIAICKEKDDEQSIIRYTEQLNKIYALYKETETEQQPENTLAKLDITTLQKLTSA